MRNLLNRNKGGLITFFVVNRDKTKLTGICTIGKLLNNMTMIKHMFYMVK